MFDKSTKILVVDDMFTMRSIVEKALKECGFVNIEKAEDGLKAWDLIVTATTPIQLVISDWNMPHCTGLELLKKVRADHRFAQLPFVLVTAESELGNVREAMIAGVTEYIVKPFNKITLEQKLQSTFQKLVR